MKGPRCARVAVIGLLAAALAACGSDPDEVLQPYDGGEGSLPLSDEGVVEGGLPTRYGLYALQDGRLGRLDGERSFQVETWDKRAALGPNVQFIVFDRALDDRTTRLQDVLTLRRVAHVRNEVAATGAAVPTGKDIWVVADLPEFAVPLDFAPVSGRPDMVRAMPMRPLQPGLYSLELRSGASAVAGRFGVAWNDIDKNAYIAANCVDRYAGQAVRYRTCAAGSPTTAASPQLQKLPPPQPAPQSGAADMPAGAAQPSPSAGPLELREVQAVKAADQGVPVLTVQGVIVNRSSTAKPVPPLVATLKDLQGAVLERWTFAAEVSHLPPGGSTGFRTETVYPTTQSTNVSVAFAPAGAGS
jgi:Protein of unknown function (DUF3426)